LKERLNLDKTSKLDLSILSESLKTDIDDIFRKFKDVKKFGIDTQNPEFLIDYMDQFNRWAFLLYFLHLFLNVEDWLYYRQINLVFDKAIHKFVQAKFPDGVLVLGSSQFSILPQLFPKILYDLEVVKINPNINISLC